MTDSLITGLLGAYRQADLHIQAAVRILVGFNNGSLLEHDGLRAHVFQFDGKPAIRWGAIREDLDADPDAGHVIWPAYLSGSAHGALSLAVGLATGRPVADLGSILCRFDSGNSAVVYEALAAPLHQRSR